MARQRTSRSNSTTSLPRPSSNTNVLPEEGETDVTSEADRGDPQGTETIESIPESGSYDDYDEEFSLDDMFEEEDIDYVLMIDD